LPAGELPAFGLYLLGKEPPPVEWESHWVVWPDFRLPRSPRDAAQAIVDAHARAATERVEIACGGGRGRTGTALACMATLAGVAPRDAVAFIRENYDRHAVETPFQKRFVRNFARLL
jgi:protein-tyrosine phosphatase